MSCREDRGCPKGCSVARVEEYPKSTVDEIIMPKVERIVGLIEDEKLPVSDGKTNEHICSVIFTRNDAQTNKTKVND
jgi:hypothetical protein